MNEAQTRLELIDPVIKAAGWGENDSQIRVEVPITRGILRGSKGRRGKALTADYVLTYREKDLAVIEAKARDKADTEGVGQAKDYADRMQIRFAYSTNGRAIYQIDMETGTEGYVDAYPGPDDLYRTCFPEDLDWRERFAAVPFETKGGAYEPRYYQKNAVNQTLEAIARGEDRILLTLATGTGKTFIAFQIAWKLFQSRWNLDGWRKSTNERRLPRVLFLSDRNILANQAFSDFSAFDDDALVRIDPESIRKKGAVPKNGSVFFTIFQTFMTGKDENGDPAPYFGEYAPDFFDLVIIDECHRGGANDESSWRGILEHFAPAVQLGMTATPRRTDNVDTYAYFGQPVYEFSLKQGINDGYLTPFRVQQVFTTLDEYRYTDDDTVLEGEIDRNQEYKEQDFNRKIEIRAREKKRVEIFMNIIDQREKTLVFCRNQEHALMIRDLINQVKKSKDPHYCVRVTADDATLGEQHLSAFRDNEKSIPTILTTSYKLSTGVDARNVRNIVLLRPINTMIEFKQIIGRGTRLFDGKDYFTIFDFVQAYKHFHDPEWDGPPQKKDDDDDDPPPKGDPDDFDDEDEDGEGEDGEPRPSRPRKIKVRLRDGKEREIDYIVHQSFWDEDGHPIPAAEFIERLYGKLPEFFKDRAELLLMWSRPDSRRNLLVGLEEKGFGPAELSKIAKMINRPDCDLYDVLAFIAFELAPISRGERVAANHERIMEDCADYQQSFLEFVLEHYIQGGVQELDLENLPQLVELKYRDFGSAAREFGSFEQIREIFIRFQALLYSGT